MKQNKSNLITGEPYTLAELFSGNRKIIIPDLQRDYCWGDDVHTDKKENLVNEFISKLILQFEKDMWKELSLGLIYGYESPEDHIQLCDGQQRITTLFLLLGMLNKKSGTNAFRGQLISDYELQDDKEPYLLYSIRENSLYFMRDLVNEFFLSAKETDVSSINSKETWFFNDYNNDPSISSMLKALSIIEKLLVNKSPEWCTKFGDYLIHKLNFLYYDLENRTNGEETFVVINTTGEPLSATQNLKPQVCYAKINETYIGKEDSSITEDWEEVEQWFWKHRCGENDTADAGFNEFLRWITILHRDSSDTTQTKEIRDILETGKYTFKIEEQSFYELYEYWEIVKFLFEGWEHKDRLKKEFLSPSPNGEMNGLCGVNQVECFQLLPLIEYIKVNRKELKDNDRNLYRLYMFLHNLCRIENVRKAINELVPHAITIARQCKDIIELARKAADLGISKTLLSDEELLKLQILYRNADDEKMRVRIEEAFWRAQSYSKVKSHEIWRGQIAPLLKWASPKGDFIIDEFEEYLKIFDRTFTRECKSNIDDVRRALLTRGLYHYPRIFHGHSIWSFGWISEEWQTLINDNIEQFKNFFDELREGITCHEMIRSYPRENEWAEFVHDNRLLGYCEEKKLQYYNNSWFLMKNERWSGLHININAFKYYLHLTNLDFAGWNRGNLWERDNTCVYFDRIHNSEPYSAINVIWNAGDNHDKVEVEIFMKPTNKAEVSAYAQEYLKAIAQELGYVWNVEAKRYRKFIETNMSIDDLYNKIDDEIYNITQSPFFNNPE